jgi:hypothetical protein
LGVNVQMPDAFSASGIPSAADIAPTGAPPPDLPPDEGQKQIAAAKAEGTYIDLDQAPGSRTINLPDQMIGGPGVGPGPAPQAPQAPTPFGPGGMGAAPAPAPSPSTWRVSDPVTGADIEISPEQILADQEREIDQSFLPLVKMEGLDPVAQRGYQIGHEFAKGQLGFKTPAEAVKAGMDAADRYMNHMYKSGLLDARALKAAKGGRGGMAVPEGQKSRIQLANEQAAKAEFKDTEATARQRVEQTFKREDFKGALAAVNKARAAMGSIKTGTSLGEYTAFREQMTAVESRLSNADAAYYEASGGALNQLKRKYDYLVGKGHLTDEDIRAIRALLDKTAAEAKNRMSIAEKRAEESAMGYLDARKKLGQLSDEEYEVQVGAARSHIGGSAGGKAATTSRNKSLLEKAR